MTPSSPDGAQPAGEEARPLRAVPDPDDDELVPSDEELLREHRNGDPQAFNEILRRRERDLLVVALRILKDPDDARDAVQAAMLRAFRSARTYNGSSRSKHPVLSWMRTIVENVSLSMARSRDSNGREVVGLPAHVSDERTADGPEESVMHFAEAKERLDRLDEPYRRTFVLVRVRGCTYAEAAVIERVEVVTIRGRICRAKALLSAPREDS